MKRKSKAAAAENDGSMSLSGHLRELRNRIAVCVVALVLGFFGCLSVAGRLVTMLTDLGTAYNYAYVYIAPQELLLVYFNLALIGAVVLTFPVLAYEAYAFCSPGLSRRERTSIALALLAGTLFFAFGVAFARFISMPFMLRFLIGFTKEVDVSASISIQEYVGFLMTVFLIFGVVFELPVVSMLLTSLGVLRAEWLSKGRRVIVVVIFVLAAIITPPDIVSQIMVAIPMIGLYELSILLSRLVMKAKRNREDEDEDDEDDGEDEEDEDK